MGGGGAYQPPFFKRPNNKKTFVHCASIFIKTIQFLCRMHLKRLIQKDRVQKAAALSNAGLKYTYLKITQPLAGYAMDPAQATKTQCSRMWGKGARKRERSVSHSGAQLQAEGGMRPGTADFCVETIPSTFLRLSQELSLLLTICVDRTL